VGRAAESKSSRVIDALLEDANLGSHIQGERIGVVGHSNGGYAALAVHGAKPSPAASRLPTADRHPTIPSSAPTCAATREAPGRSAIFRMSVISCARHRASWRRIRPFTDDTLAQVAVPVRV